MQMEQVLLLLRVCDNGFSFFLFLVLDKVGSSRWMNDMVCVIFGSI